MSAIPESLPAAAANDADALETREWLDALSAVVQSEGTERAHFLLERLIEEARQSGIDMPFSATTSYVNTIAPDQEERCPGNIEIEERLRAYMRWNAMAMVVKANRLHPEDGGDLGGHIGSFASLAHMFGAGFNHFWHGESEQHGGDCIYFQGHVSPGIYARAYMEGRLTEEQLLSFRQEVDGKGLSSYPHPKLMPGFWQFPTVSMGLGPLMAIYQARFLKYLHARGIADTANRKVWVFCGDGEMDEPESLGAIGLAARENLDNLIFVVNCNLQRLDGPVRGNGKIVQELEGEFRGSGWNVIKLLWGSNWDPLLARDKEGALRKIMMDTVDGDYQAFKANDGAYVRKHFFGRDPRTLEMVSKMSDDDIWQLRRGGHDPQKVYAAYHRAVSHKGQPTVLLIKTIKGFGMGKSGQGKMAVHQTKKLTDEDIKEFRDRFNMPIPDSELPKIPFYKPADDTPEMRYLHERRKALGGYLPKRRSKADESFTVPSLEAFKSVTDPTAEGREISTTQAYVRFLTQLLRDKALGPRVVPILVDEARTFGMEGLFRQIGIYNPLGQLYDTGRQGPGHVLPGGQGRADPAGRHQRGRRHEQLDRRGHQLQHQQPHHGAVLRVLLDVRLPAHRRSRLGRRRHAGARLPARRHQRPHHAERRRPAARGRTQPHPGRHDPQLRELRPELRARGGGDPAPRPEAHGRAAGERVLLHHAAERELPDAGAEAGHRRHRSSRACTCCKRARRRRRASTCLAAARSCASRRPHVNCWPRTGAWPPTCGAARASTSSRATGRTANVGICCIRPRSHACPSSRNSSTRTPGR